MILVDTQAVVWSTLLPKRLSSSAAEALRLARLQGTGAGIACSTLWELAMMISRGRVDCPTSLSRYLEMVQQKFFVFPITAEIAERSISFSDKYPKDPTDRLIGATALVQGLSLITADGAIRKSGEVPCIW